MKLAYTVVVEVPDCTTADELEAIALDMYDAVEYYDIDFVVMEDECSYKEVK